MKVLLDIKDSKAHFVMELLNSLSFVKAKPLSSYKSKIFEDLRQAAKEIELAKQGKIKLKSFDDFLNEIHD